VSADPQNPDETSTKTAQNTTRFTWTAQKRKAVVLLAEDELTDEEIAASIGVHRRTMATWKRHPSFCAAVDEMAVELGSLAQRKAIGHRARRIQALEDRWRRMQKVIEQRATDPDMAKVPGGDTGLMVKQIKSIKLGKTSKVVEEYEVDTALLKELREHEKQAAQELGQWTEKSEVAGPDGKAPISVNVNVKEMSREELLALVAQGADGAAAPGGSAGTSAPAGSVE